MSKGQIKYIQLEPDAFLSDVEFQAMTAEERGCYFTIILYLYRNNGKLEYDPDSQVMGTLCNCENFEQVWDKISKKFLQKKSSITHNRVTQEINKVKKRMQVAKESGLKGAEKRWGTHSNPNRVPIAKTKTKRNVNVNRRETTYDTSATVIFNDDRSRSASDELKFYDNACILFHTIKKSDKTTLRNVVGFLKEQAGNEHPKAFSEAWRIAQESAKTGDKPIALFMSRIKDEMGYRKKLKK